MGKFIFVFFLLPLIGVAQKKEITLEDLYRNKTFQLDTVPGFSDLPLDSFMNVNDVKDNAGKKNQNEIFHHKQRQKGGSHFGGP